MKNLRRPLLYGLLTIVGLIGLWTFVWAAIPQGASVIYTASDVVTMPSGTTFNGQILNAIGAFTAQGAVNLMGVLSPPQITGHTNNYNPTGLDTSNYLSVTTNATWDLTGLVGSAGKLVLLSNNGNFNLILRTESTNSIPANRFGMTADLTLPPNGMILLLYDGSVTRWHTISPTLMGAAVTASYVDFQVQGTDPTPPPGTGTLLRTYAKSGGLATRDTAGNIVYPLGTGGGGGGSTNNPFTVRVASTASITLSGTQTVDGVSVGAGGELVLVKDQGTATNGIYLASPSGPWARSGSFDTSAKFVPGFLVSVQSGTTNGGTIWQFSTTAAFTLGTTTATFANPGPGVLAERVANKNANSGYLGLGSTGRVVWTRIGGYAAHTDLAAATTIDLVSLWAASPQASIVGIQNAGAGNLPHTAVPRINGCTLANDGIEVTIVGISPTKTVTIPTGNGLLLAGNTGSVIVGQAPGGGSLRVRCNGATTIWEQVGVSSLQQVKNMGAIIGNAVDEASGVTIGNVASGTYCVMFGSTTKCYCAGVACDNIVQLSAGKQFTVMKSDGSTPLFNITDGGVFTPPLGGVVDRSVRVLRTSPQTIPTTPDEPILFDAEAFDTDNMHSISTNTSRIVFTTGGKYLVACRVRFVPNNTGVRDAFIRKNGTTSISSSRQTAVLGVSTELQAVVVYAFAANDYVELLVTQDTGSPLDIARTAEGYPACEAKQL